MKRITILVAAVALATAACAGSSTSGGTTAPAATSVTPAETPADAPAATAAPTATQQPEATATMTWDGTTCTYAGPTVVPRGARLTVALTNTPEAETGGREGAAFILAKIDDGITQADFDAWTKDHPKGSDVPPWLDQLGTQIVYPQQVRDGLPLVARQLNASRFLILCGETPNDGQAMHFGSIIETTGG
jgi:hypothetical protein